METLKQKRDVEAKELRRMRSICKGTARAMHTSRAPELKHRLTWLWGPHGQDHRMARLIKLQLETSPATKMYRYAIEETRDTAVIYIRDCEASSREYNLIVLVAEYAYLWLKERYND